jgi:hypothetical protein
MGLFAKLRMKEPVRGTAQVVSATAHRGDSSWQDIRMTLTVRGEGVPPTPVEHSCICRADRWPSPGDVLPITLDRRKPERLKVEWDEVVSARDRAWETAQAMAAGQATGAISPDDEAAAAAAGIDLDALRQAFPGASIQVESHTIGTPPAPQDDPADDRVELLERLVRLRDSGALSQAEFEAEKARILAS